MEDLLDLFGAVASGFRERMHGLDALQTLGVAPYPAHLMSLIGRYPGCSQQDLAKWTGRDKAQVARALKTLEQRGLVARSDAGADWRTFSLDLPPEGRRAVGLLARERSRAGAEMLADVSEAERDLLRHVLGKMRDALSGAEAATARTGAAFAEPSP